MCVCVCVCVFIKLHITTQSGPVILVILLPEEHGGMILNETSTEHRVLEKKMKRKKTHVIENK